MSVNIYEQKIMGLRALINNKKQQLQNTSDAKEAHILEEKIRVMEEHHQELIKELKL